MEAMFSDYSRIKTLRLSNFNTSNVETMINMFKGCKSLISLDIPDFNLSKVINMESMFMDCINLEYINFKNSKIESDIDINIDNIFYNTANNLVVCTLDQTLIFEVEKNKCAIVDCNENWRENQKKIIVENNTCVDSCDLVLNTFDYYSKCYKECPNGSYTYISFDMDNNYIINCSNYSDGLYLDNDDSFYKLFYPSCKTCDKEGNDIYHNCLECKENYVYQFSYSNYTNCYENCSNYLYFNNMTKTFYCTDTLECPTNYKKLIIDKKKMYR